MISHLIRDPLFWIGVAAVIAGITLGVRHRAASKVAQPQRGTASGGADSSASGPTKQQTK